MSSNNFREKCEQKTQIKFLEHRSYKVISESQLNSGPARQRREQEY